MVDLGQKKADSYLPFFIVFYFISKIKKSVAKNLTTDFIFKIKISQSYLCSEYNLDILSQFITFQKADT